MERGKMIWLVWEGLKGLFGKFFYIGWRVFGAVRGCRLKVCIIDLWTFFDLCLGLEFI